MNVLLAEAQVPYEQLKEMDDINGEFKDADVVLVVGANDVVNPAAKTTPGAPIYGMPILNADEAKQVVFMKRSMRPGLRRHRERAALRARTPPCCSVTPRTRWASCSTRSRRCNGVECLSGRLGSQHSTRLEPVDGRSRRRPRLSTLGGHG